MTQDQKKPAEPGIFDDFKDVAREGFKQASADINAGIDGAMRAAHYVGQQARDTYQTVEDTVGRDRLWGAGFGAKVVGGFAATKFHGAIPLYITQIGVGTAVGAVGGFILGPYIAKRYRNANGTDVANENEDAGPKPPGP